MPKRLPKFAKFSKKVKQDEAGPGMLLFWPNPSGLTRLSFVVDVNRDEAPIVSAATRTLAVLQIERLDFQFRLKHLQHQLATNQSEMERLQHIVDGSIVN